MRAPPMWMSMPLSALLAVMLCACELTYPWLVFDEPFGRPCTLIDDELGLPRFSSDDVGCIQTPTWREVEGEESPEYVCRSTGRDLTDVALCVPNLCAAGPLHLVAPFQLDDLINLVETDRYDETKVCFDGITMAPTVSVLDDPGELSVTRDTYVPLAGIVLVNGDFVVDTRRQNLEAREVLDDPIDPFLYDESYGIVDVRLPDLVSVTGRVIIAPRYKSYREDIVIVMGEFGGGLFPPLRSVDAPRLSAVNLLDEAAPSLRLGGATLARVSLPAFEELDELIIEGTPRLAALNLPGLQRITHRLVLRNPGPIFASTGFYPFDVFGHVQLGSSWEPGLVEIVGLEDGDPRDALRLFLALHAGGFRGAVRIGDNPPDNPQDDPYWWPAAKDPISALALCEQLEAMSDRALKCAPESE